MSDEISNNLELARRQREASFGGMSTAKSAEWLDPRLEVHKKEKKWDYRFLQLSAMIASWSKEPNTKVGCVIVDDKRRIVATGYNGFARGVIDDVAVIENSNYRDVKLDMTLHAEENALLFAGKSVEGCTAYVTHPPCSLCTARLIQSGIKRVVHARLVDETFRARWWDSMIRSRSMAQEAGMALFESDLAVQQECVE